MQRYKPSMNDKKYVGMQMDSQGPYVLYSDAEAVERERDKWRDLCVAQGMKLRMKEAALSAAQGEVERMREVIEIMIQFIPDPTDALIDLLIWVRKEGI